MPIDLNVGRCAAVPSKLSVSATPMPRRKVRRIVTVSGRGARGHFPSFKASGRLQYESLIEEDALRVLEIARSAAEVKSQPEVLELSVGTTRFRYTPDVGFTWRGKPVVLEVKADRFVESRKAVARLWLVRSGMLSAGLTWHLVLERELRAAGLQTELKELLRLRPAPRRQRSDLDYRAWDPVDGSPPPDDVIATRWVRAQAECDALLDRVMRRDPGDLLPAIQD
jgi:hypothetical protein